MNVRCTAVPRKTYPGACGRRRVGTTPDLAPGATPLLAFFLAFCTHELFWDAVKETTVKREVLEQRGVAHKCPLDVVSVCHRSRI